MKRTYLENESIFLRAAEPVDLEFMYEIENNSAMWEISSFTVPYSRYVLKEYIEQSSYDVFTDKQLRLMIVRKSDNRTIGIVDITDFVPLHGRGAVGMVIGEEYRRQGHAKKALGLLCEYAFGFLHFRQLYAHITIDNPVSIQLFTDCGFVRTGLLKDWLFVENEYKDVVLMQCIAPS